MSFKPTRSLTKAQKLGSICFAAIAAASMTGCNMYDPPTNAITTDDYQDRHPIVLAEAPTTLDVFPVGTGRLDPGSIEDVRSFAERYQRLGTGRIIVLAPSQAQYGVHAAVDEIRRVLASAGVKGSIGLGSYPVSDATLASPVRLIYKGVKAEVASRCGQWPRDLAGGNSTESWKNESYWNYGCATQSMLAAQVDDPRDFARARALGPSDVEMRLRAIGNVRNGQDPGTNWSVKLTPIGQVGGGG